MYDPEETMPFIHTYSGAEFRYGGLTQDFTLEDVAHHLSHAARFCGATKKFYSVAQHSILVHDLIKKQGGTLDERRAGLFHDAHEAFMGDLPTPFQAWMRDHVCGGVDYIKQAKRALDASVLPRLGVTFPMSSQMHHLVDRADKVALVIEASSLFKTPNPPWVEEYCVMHNIAAPRITLECMSSDTAKRVFLEVAQEVGDY
jgi:5'-deoxynucleotidase YfbR-like HD superfamily hydrolase